MNLGESNKNRTALLLAAVVVGMYVLSVLIIIGGR
jgi:hypothetical protein